MRYSKKILTFLVVSLIVFWFVWSEYKNRHLRDNFVITKGQITGVAGTSYRNNSKSILYDYEVNGKLFHGENNLAPCVKITGEELRLLLVNQEFPVAYDNTDFSKAEIILRKREAKFYNYSIPPDRMKIDSILSCE